MPAPRSDNARSDNAPPGNATPSDEAALDVRTEHVLAIGFSLFLILLVLSPVLENGKDDPEDGFPLSYYPMFTNDREGDQSVTFLTATNAEGTRHRLSYDLAGTGGFNQVRRQIRKRAREGQAEEMCAEVAAEVVRENEDHHADLTHVHVIRGRFLFDDYFADNKKPVSEKLYATCAINWDQP